MLPTGFCAFCACFCRLLLSQVKPLTCWQNAAAQTIKCKTCFQTFQGTTSRKMLTDHASNKHSKDFGDCFNADEGVVK